MNNIDEFYDDMADISVLRRDAINNIKLAREKIQLGLKRIDSVKKYNGNTGISPVSNVTTNDVHRDLLFFELLLNQTHGVTTTLNFQELIELTNYFTDEEEP
jgi:hypothetical protein